MSFFCLSVPSVFFRLSCFFLLLMYTESRMMFVSQIGRPRICHHAACVENVRPAIAADTARWSVTT